MSLSRVVVLFGVDALRIPQETKTIHESNLASTLSLLDKVGYFAVAALMDPRSFGSPQSRSRSTCGLSEALSPHPPLWPCVAWGLDLGSQI